MKLEKSILLALLIPLILSGCMSKNVVHDKTASEVDVFGIELFSDVDYKTVNGVVATEEPCLRGYDRNFDALDLTIGYGFDNKIRKITTRNLNTSMFGVKPGMTFEEGKKIIRQAGFSEHAPPFTFNANKYSLTFLVDSNNKIFGLTLESLD